jgi:hypothetical protein
VVNLTLSDHFNEYEVVRAGAKPQSSCGEPYEARDHYITRQFVSRLNATTEIWRSLFRRLGIRIPPNFYHSDEIVDAVVQSCLRGELRFYRLPKIEKLKAIPCGKGMGICFVKGPKPHSRVNLNPLDIKTAQAATDFVANITASDDDLVRYISSIDLLPNLSSVRDVKKIITDKLATKEILAYKIPVYTNAPPKKQGELVPATGPGYDKVPLAPESKPVSPKVVAKKSEPQTLDEAAQRLKDAKPAVVAAKAARGPLPPSNYTLEQKQAVVENGLQERYLVRVIESTHAKDEGYIGKVREHGSTISWMAPLSMVEHGDTDAEALLNAFGTRHNADKSYTILIIDREKLNEANDVQTIIPTNKNLKKLISENPQITDVPPERLSQVLNDDFAPKYYKFAKGVSANGINANDKALTSFANRQGFNAEETDLLLVRHKLANDVAAWEEFTGNGMTLDTNVKNAKAYGPVEVLMLDKKPLTLGELQRKNVITKVTAS